MTTPLFGLTLILNRGDGQRRERKSMFKGDGGKNCGHDRHKMRDQVAEP